MSDYVWGKNDLTHQTDYVVLARKYRSRTFGELIGQDALVRTLTNAIESDRIHHAYVLTGIRGTGKTSTARLLAMALNCENGPSIAWDENDPQVAAIRAGTHVDVLEFDAASNRGAEDIADLLSGVNYAPVVGRVKVYIIDEVHMLSTHAFNALLKTLEEPPPKVKFIFATTEVQKIPVTVLSRCQRFDLKRIPSEVLQKHFEAILQKEAIEAEPEAVAMVARAADGSVRDGLSLLDQAIALSHGQPIKAALVQEMLGLADRVRVYDLLDALLGGRPAAALAVLDDLYAGGQDASLVVQGMLDVLHLVTRLKIVPGLRDSSVLSELERTRGVALADKLGMANLSRAYQMLALAAQEVKQAERPYEALSMAAVRLAYLAPMPSVDRLMMENLPLLHAHAGAPAPQNAGAMAVESALRSSARVADVVAAQNLLKQGAVGPAVGPAPWEDEQQQKTVATTVEDDSVFGRWRGLVKQLRKPRPALAAMLAQQGRCLDLDNDNHEVILFVEKGLHGADELLNQLRDALKELTGHAWFVTESATRGDQPTVHEVEAKEAENRRIEATTEPLIMQALSLFPGAVVEEVKYRDLPLV